MAVGSHFEQFAMRPHVGAVMNQKQRRVAEQQDFAGVGLAFKRLERAGEAKLGTVFMLDHRCMLPARGCQLGGLAIAPRFRPLPPALAGKFRIERAKQRSVVEPVGAGLAEIVGTRSFGGVGW